MFNNMPAICYLKSFIEIFFPLFFTLLIALLFNSAKANDTLFRFGQNRAGAAQWSYKGVPI
jgi:hypothetical protein